MLRTAFLLLLSSPALLLAAKPNIVFIMADDIGYGDLGCYGATAVMTPNVDRLAAQGLRFTDAHSSSATCTPTRFALLTGKYPWRQKGTGILPGDAALIIPPGSFTLPQMLKNAGYKTAAVGKWHLGLGAETGAQDWNAEVTPGPREIGFDYSFLIPATGDRTPCVYLENQKVRGLDLKDPLLVGYAQPVGTELTGKEHPEMLKMKLHHGHDETIINGISRIGTMTGGNSARWKDEDMADDITQKARQWLAQQKKDEPFFLYFATHGIHVPRAPHPRFVGKTTMGARGDALVEFDWSVGEILQALDEQGLAENTLLILSSDNGPVIQDGYVDHAADMLGDHKPAGPLRGGKGSNFEGGTRVPFIIRWPAKVKVGESAALVCQMDMLASLAAMTEQSLPEEAAPDSFNVLPALLGESAEGRDHLVEDSNMRTLRVGTWKYLPARPGPPLSKNTSTETGFNKVDQLYDLSQDLGERNNLAEAKAEKTTEMKKRLEEILKGQRTRF